MADPVSLGILLAAAPIIALTTTQTFTRNAFALSLAEGGNAYEAIALMSMLSVTCIFLGAFVASRAIAEELPIYFRERLINLGLVPYVLSKLCTLGVFSIVQSALLIVIVSRFIAFPGGDRALLEVYGGLLLTNLAALTLGLFISAISTNGLQATLILMMVFIPQQLLAGGIQPLSRVTEAGRLASTMLISRWSLSLLGHAVDLNTRLEAQLPKNDYLDQFAVDPARASLLIVGLGIAFSLAAIVALRAKDLR
jgi:hypothetical protein